MDHTPKAVNLGAPENPANFGFGTAKEGIPRFLVTG